MKDNKIIGVWLLIGAIMVYVMLLIGGITRLTGSGLSIVEWDVIGGTIPPFSQDAWQEKFELYQQSPQYKNVNYNMTVDEFKSIFWWEYIHRLWGRMIGLAFFIPFLIFRIKKMLSPELMKQLVFVFILGAFQGFMGWFMVKSGLVDIPRVSAYRLTAHLILALFLYSYLLWLALEQFFPEQQKVPIHNQPFFAKWIKIFVIILGIQLFYGGLMSGLKAAVHYPTFPLMNGRLIPGQLFIFDTLIENLFENTAMVQFIHRGAAYTLILLSLLIWLKNKKVNKENKKFSRGITMLFHSTNVQLLLGIVTIVHAKGEIPVLLGVLHQTGAVLVLSALLYNVFLLKRYK